MRRRPRPATIIFDLGRTLVPFSLAPLQERVRGCRAEAERLFAQAETGRLDPERFRGGVCALTGLAPEEFPAWWNSIFQPGWLIAPELVRELQPGYRLGLLSNTNAIHFDFLRAERPLLDEFDFRVLSHEVGAAKPHPAIYAAAEAQAGCPPGAILYFDDVPEYVVAAQRRGWHAVQFREASDLAVALRRYPD